MSQLAPTPKYPAVKFDQMGVKVKGKVVYPPEDRQALEYGTRKPKVWPDGNPVMQTKIVLDTAEGRRALYVQGRSATAVRNAIFKAGAPDLEVGADLEIWWSENGEAKGGGQPPKLYEAVVTPPEPGDSDGFDPADLV